MKFNDLDFCEFLENARTTSQIFALGDNIQDSELGRLAIPTRGAERWKHVESFYNLQEGLLNIHYTKLSVDLIRYYSYVLLSGQYCASSELKENLEKLESYLTQYSCYDVVDMRRLPGVYKGVFDRLNDISSQIIYDSPLIIFQRIKSLILNFLKRLESNFSFNSQKELFSALKNRRLEIPEKEKAYLMGFEYILKLYEIEHFKYEPSDDIFTDLLLLKQSFQELQLLISENNELKKIVELKCDFLLYKIAKRTGKHAFSYLIDNNKIEIDLNDSPHFKGWKAFIDTHYSDGENSKKEQRKNLERLSELEPDEFEFVDYHTYIKLCKDDFKRFDILEEIKKNLKSKKAESEFDKTSLKILRSYVFNNSISLSLESKGLSYSQLYDIYESIRTYQHTDNIKNYFPWLKLAKYLTNVIEEHFRNTFNGIKDNNDSSKIKPDFNNLLELFNKCHSKLKSAFKWSYTMKFKPFQNDIKHCLSEESFNILEFGELELFFPSSYVVPLYYSEISEEVKSIDFKKNQIESFETTFDLLNGLIDNIKSTNRELEESKKSTNKELEESKNTIKQQERRSIEVLGVFSAVALFSIGSIQIFKDNVDLSLNTILNFILAFAFSLSLFIYLIWIITRENLKKLEWYHLIVLGLYILAFVLIYYNIKEHTNLNRYLELIAD